MELLLGLRSIRAARPDIEALQRSCGQDGDVMASLQRVECWTELNRTLPLACLMHRDGKPYALVWLVCQRKFGIVLGLAKSGNLCGQGGVIARPMDRPGALETTARIVLRAHLAHTIILSLLLPPSMASQPFAAAACAEWGWHLRDVRCRLDLSGGKAVTMERLGYKMRRNIGYYRRRAEERLGCRFLPELDAAQRREAVAALYDKGTYAIDARRARLTDATLLATPGHFAMGLQDRSGAWLSFVAGWREPGGTHIDWQLNHGAYADASLSTVMRGYLLDHEVERGSPAIVFVGLTSELWSRVCEPGVCADLLATRAGLLGRVVHWVTNKISPNGQVAVLHARAAAVRA